MFNILINWHNSLVFFKITIKNSYNFSQFQSFSSSRHHYDKTLFQIIKNSCKQKLLKTKSLLSSSFGFKSTLSIITSSSRRSSRSTNDISNNSSLCVASLSNLSSLNRSHCCLSLHEVLDSWNKLRLSRRNLSKNSIVASSLDIEKKCVF